MLLHLSYLSLWEFSWGSPACLGKAHQILLSTLNQWETTLRLQDGAIEGEREGRLLNKTSWDHFHVSPCRLGWRNSKLDLSSIAAKAPLDQQLFLRRSSSPKHNHCEGNLFKQELISHGLMTTNTDTDYLRSYSHKEPGAGSPVDLYITSLSCKRNTPFCMTYTTHNVQHI